VGVEPRKGFMAVDKIGYIIKQRLPFIFGILEVIVGYQSYLASRTVIRRALEQARLEGRVGGVPACMRPITIDDAEAFLSFLANIPEKHFIFFRPHGFGREEIYRILAKPYYLTYGLFVNDRLIGYCLLKLYPGRKAFLGRILSPEYTGLGIGKFFSRFLRWQAAVIGFRLRSTISEDNLVSMQSHKSVGGMEVISDLPNGYKLIEFTVTDPGLPPQLQMQGDR
jgi:RimJ/RimL family protein N-acetyltransferase